jgi:hypothetical protein
MTDYSKAKIYKIIDNTNGNIYIGSTTQALSKRLAKHRDNYKSYKNETSDYMTSFEIIKNNNYLIVLLEECPCENREQLHKIERKHIDENPCINKNIPTRTVKEYGIKYRAENSERIKQLKSLKYVCPCKKEYTSSHKLRHERTQFHQNFLKAICSDVDVVSFDV